MEPCGMSRRLESKSNRTVVSSRGASERLRRARVGTGLAFGLVGLAYFTWAARLPAIKTDLGLSNGQLAVALVGLEAGALAGLQLGGVLVPRTGSRAALAVSLPALAVLLAGPGLATSLPTLTAAAFVLATAVNVATVAMNAHGVAVEQRYGRPILSGMYAMHSLGGILGAGLGAVAAALAVGRSGHFLVVATVVAVAGLATGRLLLPASIDVGPAGGSGRDHGSSAATTTLGGWLRGWSGPIVLLGPGVLC
jgi:predicted MFS family arabinose efflux permease